VVRAFFNSSQNRRHDNMGLWAFQQAPASIKKGTIGSIDYTVIAVCKHAFPGSNLKPDRVQTGPLILSNKRSFIGDRDVRREFALFPSEKASRNYFLKTTLL
jgi:hypothetical protein